MRMRKPLLVVCGMLLLCGAMAAAACPGQANSRRKTWPPRPGEGNDRAKQVQDFCQAAALDPKEKKYSDNCNELPRIGLIQDDHGDACGSNFGIQEP
jgi:hypothetical protein